MKHGAELMKIESEWKGRGRNKSNEWIYDRKRKEPGDKAHFMKINDRHRILRNGMAGNKAVNSAPTAV